MLPWPSLPPTLVAVAAPGSPKAGGLWRRAAVSLLRAGGVAPAPVARGGAREEREGSGVEERGELVVLVAGVDDGAGAERAGVGRARSGPNRARSGLAGFNA